MGMIVPISEPRAVQSAIGPKPPSPTMLAIAAAHMDQQGRLFQTAESTIPMSKDILENMQDPEVQSKYEDTVDKYIKDKGLKKGDTFKVDDPERPDRYEYLGPESGGRKDWRKIKVKDPDLVS